MKKLYYFIALCTSVILYSCQTEKSWQPLFNGNNLENWDLHLGSPLEDYDSLARVVTSDRVFSVVEKNGEKLIRISGEINGSLATHDSFENYHLQLIFRWGDEVYTNRNSGLLYHSFGEFGEALDTWMVNIECQLMHERLGDTYLMNNTYCETAAAEADGVFRYDPNGEVLKFSEEHNGKLIQKAVDVENPLGDWNTVDLYCVDQTAVHVVNGQTVMVNNNTGIIENGAVVPLRSGKIQIQSEGAELFIKAIQIKPIKQIPNDILP